MADQKRSDFYVDFTMMLCSRKKLPCLVSYEARIHRLALNGLIYLLTFSLDISAQRIMAKTT